MDLSVLVSPGELVGSLVGCFGLSGALGFGLLIKLGLSEAPSWAPKIFMTWAPIWIELL